MLTTPATARDVPGLLGPPMRWRPLLAVAIALILLAALWDLSALDLPLSHKFGSADGFPLKENWWLRAVLHDGMAWLSRFLYLGILLLAWRPRGLACEFTARERGYVVVAVLLVALAVNLTKRMSLTSCPWDLIEFGGTAHWVSHWAWGVRDGGAGRCFPSGHASASLSFLPLAIPLLASAVPLRQRIGWRCLALVLGFGLILGVVQLVRGGHYLSHTLWALPFCWGTAWLVWLVWQKLPFSQETNGTPGVPSHPRSDTPSP